MGTRSRKEKRAAKKAEQAERRRPVLGVPEPASNQSPRANQGPNMDPSPRRDEDPDEYLRQKPSWQLCDLLLEQGKPFSWFGVKGPSLQDVVRRLGHLESKTFSELKNSGCHEIDYDKLSPAFLEAVEAEGRKDSIWRLYSIRVQGKVRVFAVRYENALFLRWYDAEHQICPSTLKESKRLGVVK